MNKKEIKLKVWTKIPTTWKLAITNARCKTRFLTNITNTIIKEHHMNPNSKLEDIIAGSTRCSFCLTFDFVTSPEGLDFWQEINKWVNYYSNIN